GPASAHSVRSMTANSMCAWAMGLCAASVWASSSPFSRPLAAIRTPLTSCSIDLSEGSPMHRLWVGLVACCLALLVGVGCGKQPTEVKQGQPRLENPDDPRLKDLKPAGVANPGGGGVGTPGQPTPKVAN